MLIFSIIFIYCFWEVDILAVCPKCKEKIPFYHLSQFCPHCGVNVRFYDFDKKFYRDAKRAELSVAKTNIFIAHIKAALIGSKLSIIRLCVMILPLVSLLVPYATAKITQPFVDDKLMVSALGLYQAISGGHLDYVMTMMKSGIDAQAFRALALVMGGIALTAVAAVVLVLLTVLSFTSIKKMPKVLVGICVIGIALTAATAVLAFRFVSVADASRGTIVRGGVSFGYIVTALMFAVNLVINTLIIKKGYNIVYKEGDLERKEIAKKVKAGEIDIDSLPQPIVETEETRQIDLEIRKQQALYHDREGGGGSEEV